MSLKRSEPKQDPIAGGPPTSTSAGLEAPVELEALARELRTMVRGLRLEGYLDGKTSLRNAVAERLACSQLEAEDALDAMESRGILRFTGDPRRSDRPPGVWTIEVTD